jgi:class 3 adenylate cyclase
MKRRTFITGIVSTVIFVLGVLFKTFSIAGAGMLLLIGLLLYIFGFILLLFIDKVSIESRRNARISLFLLLLVIVLSSSYGLFQIFHWQGSSYIGYASVIMSMIFFMFFASQLESRKLMIRKDRQLASILFTDVVGYTKMMGENETDALEKLKDNHQVQKRLLRKYRGKWIKEIGDGSMAVFYTASEAVLCAIEIQVDTNKKGTLKLRMGIHVSEIVFTDDDIFGDGVNVASRIANKAGAGEIYFSDSVFYNIRNRESHDIISMGEAELKNVAYKLQLYKISF